MEETIINRVANSNLITIDLSEWISEYRILSLDIQPHLFHGLILKEADFRDWIKSYDWSQYQASLVKVFCSNNAVIPLWAWMLLSAKLTGNCLASFYGADEITHTAIGRWVIDKKLNDEDYTDKRLVLKGCSSMLITPDTYAYFTEKLLPITKSIMFGEACSTVPVYKKALK